jgi:uncharacterized Tic20 family protein
MAHMAGISSLEPTQDERNMATLAHALSILGFIAPLVIFLIKRPSRFVSFHALQALLWHVAYFAFTGVLLVTWFCTIFLTIAHTAATKATAPPVGIFLFFPLLWLGLMAGGILTLVFAIVFAIKASQGEWAEYPVLGSLARKLLKIGPYGAAMV